MMYSRKYVIPLIVILLLVFFSPYIYDSSAPGFEAKLPELAKAKGEHCIENETWMEAWHMDLIHKLRTNYLYSMYEGKLYTSKTYGETYNSSLNECWKCHESKEDFCNKCHEYSGVDPYCFESCHNTPEFIEQIRK